MLFYQSFYFDRRKRNLLDETGQLALIDFENSHHGLAGFYINYIILIEQARPFDNRIVGGIVVFLKQLQFFTIVVLPQFGRVVQGRTVSVNCLPDLISHQAPRQK